MNLKKNSMTKQLIMIMRIWKMDRLRKRSIEIDSPTL